MSETMAVGLQGVERQFEGGLPAHAEGGRVHQQVRAGKDSGKVAPGRDADVTRMSRRDRFRLLPGSIRQRDDLHTARQQPVNDAARRAAGPQHHGMADLAVPAGHLLVEIAQEAGDVRIHADQPARVVPDRVDRADGDGAGLDLVHGGEGRLLVRNGDVAAGETAIGERAQKICGAAGFDGFPRIVAVNAIGLQPETVDQRRADMLDGPADATGADHDGISPSRRRAARSGSSGMPRMVK
jgi:hypothetical protein